MERLQDRIVMGQSERDVLKIMAPVLQGKRDLPSSDAWRNRT